MRYLPLFLILLIHFSCSQKSSDQTQTENDIMDEKTFPDPDFSMDNLLAWCIVPFDVKERTPGERINMLTDLGFTQYAYDWREKHLNHMTEEIDLARKNDIDMMAVWMWIDANSDTVGSLGKNNERILEMIRETGLKTQLWIGINANFFDGLDEPASVEKGLAMVHYLSQRASDLGCKIALYNHGDWFGDPRNQVKIIEKIPDYDIGIIYNFHHAHEQLDDLGSIINAMKDYLWVVNLNGMKKEGPKIMPIGKGNREKDMIIQFLEADFNGPWGILGHVEDRDVQEVLKENLEGLKTLY